MNINSYSRFLMVLFFLVITKLAFATVPTTLISNYQATFTPGYDEKNNLAIAIRSYTKDQTRYFLLVDPYTLLTRTVAANAFKTQPNLAVGDTPYVKVLTHYTSFYPLQNAGLTHADWPQNGMFLTIDMCPAKKPFEKKFFQSLVDRADKNKQPVPIALSMSGLWMQKHPDDFAWLLAQKNANKLAITWVNHTYNHSYYPGVPLKNNYMLAQPANFTNEILQEEIVLLQHQQTPSVFLRFPGLVADKELILKSRQVGLIPLGSDAWLAKNQNPTAGSIILVHGNSNEPLGIEKVMPLLQKPDLILLPLNQAVLPASKNSQ